MPIRAQPGLVCVALVACHGGASAPAVPNPPGGSVHSVATQIDFVPAALLSSEQLRPSLVVSGTELYFSDASEHPVKRVSVSGGTPTPLAYRAGAPVRLVVSGRTVFWSDGGRLFRTSIDTRETTLLASGNLETSPTLLADGDAVYWVRTVSSGDCSPACIHRIERIAGGTTSVVAEARQEISGFVQDTAWVYWAERGLGPVSATCNCGSAVKKAPKAGGPATLLVDGTLNGLFPPPPPPFIQAGWSPSANVALSGGSVIFSDGVRILSIPLAGGSVSIVATLVTPRPRALVADATSVFWIDDRSASTAALPAGSPAVLATGLTAPVDLFLDATGLLIADRGRPLGCCLAVGAGSILQIPRTGGEVAVRAAHLDAPTSVSTDGDSLYWTEAWRVGSLPAAGGPERTVASGISAPLPRLAANHETVFVLDGPYVKKLPLPGGVLERAATASPQIGNFTVHFDDLVVDDANAFVAVDDSGTGSVAVVPLAGGPSASFFPKSFPGPYDCVHRVVATAGRIYWTSASPTIPEGCAIHTAQLPAGPVSVLFDGTVRDFAVDGADVFFSTAAIHVIDGGGAHEVGQEGINRIGAMGGPVTRLPADVGPAMLAVESSSLYWISLLGYVETVTRAGTGLRRIATEPFIEEPELLDEIVATDGAVYWTDLNTGNIRRFTIP